MKTKILRLLLMSAIISPAIDPSSALPVESAGPAVHNPGPPPVEVRQRWRAFTSDSGRFSVLLPVPPVARTVELSSVKETLYLFHCQADNAYYFVEYADRPAKSVQLLGTEKMLSIADEGFLKANHAVPVSKHLFTLDGYPGHEIIINRYDGRKETQHTYLVGARRYTLMTIQPRDPARDQAADADKFFNSFTLLSAKTPIKN